MEFGLIGEHLGHSFSKEIHGKLMPDLPYELREISREDLPAFLREAPFKAINVTIPYKQDVIPYLSSISGEAQRIGAVNTIVKRPDGSLAGYNTDYYGFSELAKRAGISLKGRKVLILGAGGAAKTVRAVALDQGASEVRHALRHPRSAEDLQLGSIPSGNSFEIVINATPAGMYPDDGSAPVRASDFPCLEGALDLIYNPLRTNFILDARAQGAKAEGGLYMLVAQAVRASELFHSCCHLKGVTEEIFSSIAMAKGNIVLCGMPSSGKSTIGQMLAERLGMGFTDTDELITRREGRPIRDIFATRGEKVFRAIESQVISDISRSLGCVIATGGGAVLNQANVHSLRRNGTIILIQRDPELLLATPDRPLSSRREDLLRLLEERREAYLNAADHIVSNNASPGDCVRQIEQCLQKTRKY